MKTHRIPIDDEIHLSPFTQHDIPSVVEFLNDGDVYENLLSVPHPYEEKHAVEWMEKNRNIEEEHGRPISWAIRNSRGTVTGGVGLKIRDLEMFHRVEIGYWMAKPFWGQGIMTRVVGGFCRYLFETDRLRKITAHVFRSNAASVCVLRKNGFQREGLLRQHFFKNDQYIDAYVFGLLKEENV